RFRLPSRDRRSGGGQGHSGHTARRFDRRRPRNGRRLPARLAMTAHSTKRTALTLGPLHYNWPAEYRRDFYARIADEAPVDTVCLGEVVCTKRAPFTDPDLPAIAERLVAGGKEVVF